MSKFKLPNGVTIEGKLYNIVELDEIRGRHQDILINPKSVTPIDFIKPILEDVIIDVTDGEEQSIIEQVSKKELILKRLPIQDIQFLLVKLRETTYGKDYMMDMKCTHCEADNKAKLDLSTLEVFKRVDKLEESKMILPKEGIEFRYGFMTLADLLKIAADKDESEFLEKVATSTISYLLASLGDNTQVTPKDIDDLRALDLEFIKDNAPELATIDLKVEHTCTSCKKDFEQELPALAADFLLLSRT